MSDSAAYCPSCRCEIPRSEVGESPETFGEHTKCGSDLYLSEGVVVDMIERITTPDDPDA